MITVNLLGLDKVQQALKRKEVALTRDIGIEMDATLTEINNKQKELAPVDNGFLRSSLHLFKVSPLNQGIISSGPGSSYAPYQEFGTGGLVNIPQGLEAEAAQFKGTTGRQVNMKAQPFFFPPFFAAKQEFLNRIDKLLSK